MIKRIFLHLNMWGNRKFSKYIGDYIVDNYPEIKQWDESDERVKPWVEKQKKYEEYYNKVSEEKGMK